MNNKQLLGRDIRLIFVERVTVFFYVGGEPYDVPVGGGLRTPLVFLFIVLIFF